ncbi:hypothetical protein MIMGU_mgv1a0204861mg, partial [Erythranthe guttata]
KLRRGSRRIFGGSCQEKSCYGLEKSSGKIKSCSIHDLMRELCMRKAKQEKFLLHVTNGIIAKKSIKNQRRLCVNESDLNCLANIFGSTTRTIIYFPHGTGSTGHLEHFTFLRLLDVVYDHFNFSHSEETVRFPAHVFELFHLKYRAFYFPITGNGRHVEIPSVISNLENLQTLIIPKKSHQPSKAHYLLLHWPVAKSRGGSYFCSRKSANPLGGKRSCMHRKHRENDSKRYEIGTLKKLTLSGWELSCEDMRIVGSLPNLQVLKLKNFALDGDTWETTEGEFSQLKFLLLHYTDLGHWISESSHFPILKCLFLHHCQYLSEIPDGIGDIPTLELIEVKGDNIYLAQSAKQIQEIQREYGNYDLEVLCID